MHIDVAGCCWHWRVEVTSQVKSQLAVKPECGLEGEVVEAVGEDDIHPVMGDGDVCAWPTTVPWLTNGNEIGSDIVWSW